MDTRPYLNFTATEEHHLIKEWASYHHAVPQIIDHPQAEADQVGLRLDFPGKGDEKYLPAHQDVSWEEFFQRFEEQELSFLYIPLEEMEAGKLPENAYKFIKRERVNGKAG